MTKARPQDPLLELPQEPEFGNFADEVLNAEWLPAKSAPERRVATQPQEYFPDEAEIEAFLKMIYVNQG